jgi:hypothetical protein
VTASATRVLRLCADAFASGDAEVIGAQFKDRCSCELPMVEGPLESAAAVRLAAKNAIDRLESREVHAEHVRDDGNVVLAECVLKAIRAGRPLELGFFAALELDGDLISKLVIYFDQRAFVS